MIFVFPIFIIFICMYFQAEQLDIKTSLRPEDTSKFLSEETTKYEQIYKSSPIISCAKDDLEKLILLHPGPFVTARIFSRRFQACTTNIIWCQSILIPLADRGGGDATDVRPLFGPISFIFMQFTATILPNNRFLAQIQWLAPSVWEILDPPLNSIFFHEVWLIQQIYFCTSVCRD